MPIILAIVLIIGSALTGGIVAYQRLYIPPENQTITRTVTPTPTEVVIPTPTLQGKTQGTSLVDADPLVNCNIHSSCGGGTISLKKSVCDNSVCCQVGNTWILYHDKAKCTQDQKNYLETKYIRGTTQSTNSEPVITCVLSWGTYQLPKSICDGYKNAPTINTDSDPIVTCQSNGEDLTIKKSLCDSLVDCQIGNQYFLLYPSDCTRLQAQYLQETQAASQNTANAELNKQNNSQCKNEAKKWYDNMYAQYGSSTGTGDFALKVYEPQYRQMLLECDRLYPI